MEVAFVKLSWDEMVQQSRETVRWTCCECGASGHPKQDNLVKSSEHGSWTCANPKCAPEKYRGMTKLAWEQFVRVGGDPDKVPDYE